MSSTIEKSFSIGKKKVTIIYDLRLYSEKDYRLDFRDFVEYQTKKEKVSDKEIEWQFYSVKEFTFIPYSDFLNIVSNLFTKVVYRILREDSSIMVSDDEEFKLRFIMLRVPGRAWYFEENPREELGEEYSEFLNEIESEVVEHHNFLSAGVFLIQAVAAPWVYTGRIDYRYIYRYIRHELEHHKQYVLMKGYYEDKVREKIRQRFETRIPKIMNERLQFLFLTVYELLIEGIADFVTIANRPRININMESIYEFRRNLDALTTIKGKNNVENFWEKNLAYGTFDRGAYYCGKIMCFTIELAFAKKLRKPPLIYLENGEEHPLEAIDKVMSKQKVFYIGNPDYAVFKRAYDEITKYKYNYRKFILLYEWACKELGIRKRNMVMLYGFFDDLKKKATKFYERYTKKQRRQMYQRIKEIARSRYSVG